MPLSQAQQDWMTEKRQLLREGYAICSTCGIQPVSEFYKCAAKWSGVSNRCQPCDSAYKASRYVTNRDSILEQQREYREANRDSILEYKRKYRQANQDSIREYDRDYHAQRRAADPLWRRLRRGAVRARKFGVPVEPFTSADLLAHWESQGIDPDRCVYCSGPFEHLDHAYPLKREGTPGHVMSNCVPACSHCNSTLKQDRTAEEFAAVLASA